MVFTPTGGGAATLADISASPQLKAVVDQWPGDSIVQVEKVYGAANQVIFARGNIGGDLVFTVQCSYGSYDSAATAYKNAYTTLLGAAGSLVCTPYITSTVTLTFAGAILEKIIPRWGGVGLYLQYRFKVTTIT